MKDEIQAYNPLVPKGKELVATLMFEIDNEVKRKEFLCSVGGIENQTFLEVDGEKIFARPEGDTDRTNEDGKASSVHFLHFDFSMNQIEKFTADTSKILIGFENENYRHFSEISKESKKELSKDFNA